MSTSKKCDEIPSARYYNRIEIPLSRNVLDEVFLDYFIAKEKSQLNDALRTANQVTFYFYQRAIKVQ